MLAARDRTGPSLESMKARGVKKIGVRLFVQLFDSPSAGNGN